MTNIMKSEIQKEALELYLKGVSIVEIGRQLKKSKNTINNWKKLYNWANHKENYLREQAKNVVETETERKLRLINIAKAIQITFAKALKAGKVEIKPHDALKAMEFESKVTGMMVDKLEASVEHKHSQIKLVIIRPEDEEFDDDSGKIPTD